MAHPPPVASNDVATAHDIAMPRWLAPALVVSGLTPLAAAAAWAITRWQIDRDDHCAQDATHASCGLSAGGAAAFVVAFGLVAVVVALAFGRWGHRSDRVWPAWTVVAAWSIAVAVYLALPPSG